ncbi:hypothetical protein [Geosporobacter ferrireducens]|uniref:Uncharacterized protein n=1 Tax=Geosporobacter ferrireducens TaxID=1424294 RepID=A0A1D8GMU7_9FIRM|nr:hypothetical protein [Geosporobacter ferrireducens]AOT72228.1 hypothetical protein Gferi_23395 [Geosporobacter ferrireducens]
MNELLKTVRALLVALSYFLSGFSAYSWASGLRFKGSELLPILMSTVLNLLCFIIYKMLPLNSLTTVRISENKIYRFLPLIGFYINFVFIGLCIIVIVGFSIIP